MSLSPKLNKIVLTQSNKDNTAESQNDEMNNMSSPSPKGEEMPFSPLQKVASGGARYFNEKPKQRKIKLKADNAKSSENIQT